MKLCLLLSLGVMSHSVLAEALKFFQNKTKNSIFLIRCHEAAFNVLATPIRTAKQLGLHFDSKILDIENVDLATGKMMDQVTN